MLPYAEFNLIFKKKKKKKKTWKEHTLEWSKISLQTFSFQAKYSKSKY